ncbi:MAG: acyltransferase family protein [Bacteroidia bacterium]
MVENKKIVYFPNLDVLRFLCAFMIIAHHSFGGWKCWNGDHAALTDSNKKLTIVGEYITTLIENTSFGVDIFFLISGFLITYLLIVEKQTNGKVDIKKFFIRRFLRIWPLYFFIVVMASIFLIIKKDLGPPWLDQPPAPNYLPYCFFLGNFEVIRIGASFFPLSHLWSICVEEHFYIVWPFVIAFVPFKHLSKVFFMVILSSMAFRAYYFHFDHDNFWKYFGVHTITNMDTLAIGSWCGLLYYEKPRVFKTPLFIRILVVCLFLFIFGQESYRNADTIVLQMLRKYIYLLFAIFMIANFMFNEKTMFNRKKTIFHYFGKTSYGIYMYQSIVITILTDYLLLVLQVKNPWIYYGTVVATIILVSTLSWELFEKQILKLKKRFEIIRTAR